MVELDIHEFCKVEEKSIQTKNSKSNFGLTFNGMWVVFFSTISEWKFEFLTHTDWN